MDESDSEKEVKRLLLIFHLKEKDLQFEKDRNMALNKLIDLTDEELKKTILETIVNFFLVFPKNRYADFSFKLNSSQPANGLRLK